MLFEFWAKDEANNITASSAMETLTLFIKLLWNQPDHASLELPEEEIFHLPFLSIITRATEECLHASQCIGYRYLPCLESEQLRVLEGCKLIVWFPLNGYYYTRQVGSLDLLTHIHSISV